MSANATTNSSGAIEEGGSQPVSSRDGRLVQGEPQNSLAQHDDDCGCIAVVERRPSFAATPCRVHAHVGEVKMPGFTPVAEFIPTSECHPDTQLAVAASDEDKKPDASTDETEEIATSMQNVTNEQDVVMQMPHPLSLDGIGDGLGVGAHAIHGPGFHEDQDEVDEEGYMNNNASQDERLSTRSSDPIPLSAFVVSEAAGSSRGERAARTEARALQRMINNAPLVTEARLERENLHWKWLNNQIRGMGRWVFAQRYNLILVLATLAAAAFVATVFLILRPPDACQNERSCIIRNIVSSTSSSDALSDISSPQFRALDWIVNKDVAIVPIKDRSRLVQRFNLAVFYFSTGGEQSWLCKCNFLNETHECQWHNSSTGKGVRCSDQKIVDRIELSGNNLTGNLPLEIGDLSGLKRIWLNWNALSGEIPATIGSLKELSVLSIHNNGLTGRLPVSLGKLTNLTKIDFGDNSLGGRIPPTIGHALSLTHILLYNNSLTNTIPASLGRLSNLEKLRVGMNNLSGSIPASINDLQNLQDFSAEGNNLNGTLPFKPGSLPNLLRLLLWENQLSGSIPTSLGDLSSMKQLLLGDNRFTSTLPESIGNLHNLEVMQLWNNSLTGTVPSSIGHLEKMIAIGLGHNMLTGHIPSEIAEASGLLGLALESNSLSGPIPQTLANSELRGLSLHSNRLSGPLPKHFGSNTNLAILELGNNSLVGSVDSLKELKALVWLNIAMTNLTGTICQIGSKNPMMIIADCKGPNAELPCPCCLSTFCCRDGEPCSVMYLDISTLMKHCVEKETCYNYGSASIF